MQKERCRTELLTEYLKCINSFYSHASPVIVHDTLKGDLNTTQTDASGR